MQLSKLYRHTKFADKLTKNQLVTNTLFGSIKQEPILFQFQVMSDMLPKVVQYNNWENSEVSSLCGFGFQIFGICYRHVCSQPVKHF